MAKIGKKKIIIAMSGGVDSSVTAALLKSGRFLPAGRQVDVVGVMMKFWSDKNASRILTDEKDINRCCSVESEKLARLVANKIGIPFYVINVEKEFKKKVVDYFLNEYKKGKTPNPCVVCNKEIKFGILIEKALSMGADYVATGHYARTSLNDNFFLRGEPLYGAPSPRKKKSFRSVELLKGKDREKDQSYFLWQLNQKQLSRVLFPVGGYTKPEVRKLAKKFKLPTAETPESQEVCFVQNSTAEFLKKYLKTKSGKITDKFGNVLGSHQGLWFYTIGQRKGIEVQQGPWYVVEKNFKNNILVVSKDKKDLLKKEFIAENANWILPVKFPLDAEVKIRYKSKLAKAKILKSGKKIKVVFQKPQQAVTSGQSAVFYKGSKLLGGGIID